MDVIVVYFSQTGNTEKIAEAIRDGIVSTGNRCDLQPIKEVNKSDLIHYDLIAIGCPTFYYREPLNVKGFIQALEPVDGNQAFIFCTHGSVMGNTLYYLNEELGLKGYAVVGSFDSYGSSSLQFYPEVMHTQGHPDSIEYEEARTFGSTICSISERVREGETSLEPRFPLTDDTWWAEHSRILNPRVLRKVSPPLALNPDICTRCLECQERCPVGAIHIEQDPPVIQGEACIFCWFCEKVCPVGAIEADWNAIAQASRRNLWKYVEELRLAEKAGRFRPYCDYEKIV